MKNISERTIEERLARVESLLDLSDAPPDWVTPEKIDKLRIEKGHGSISAKRYLIWNFGEIQD